MLLNFYITLLPPSVLLLLLLLLLLFIKRFSINTNKKLYKQGINLDIQGSPYQLHQCESEAHLLGRVSLPHSSCVWEKSGYLKKASHDVTRPKQLQQKEQAKQKAKPRNKNGTSYPQGLFGSRPGHDETSRTTSLIRLNFKFLNQSAVAPFGDREASLILESALMVSTTLPTVITLLCLTASFLTFQIAYRRLQKIAAISRDFSMGI